MSYRTESLTDKEKKLLDILKKADKIIDKLNTEIISLIFDLKYKKDKDFIKNIVNDLSKNRKKMDYIHDRIKFRNITK
ncbi:MAG: hypothetical protein ACFFG0_20800 [Candidatus Thorarchaeota archaeon]